MVLALEDVHWADPTTLDFIRGVVERGARAPLLLLITARPEFRPPWAIRSHHATISLAPLDQSQVRQMVTELSARHALSKQIVDGVTERSGGVPLFVEEVTRLLLERGEQTGAQAIPPTLQQSLMARLDRLGPAKEVAQIAAVIGRDFSYTLLRAAVGMDDLARSLDRLAEADILLVQGVPPQSEYRFKHALIQDAAYENLLKSRRQVLHRRLGEVLRDQFTAIAATQPELVAHHFSQAGLIEAAIEWWGKAGQHSLERSALEEATAQLSRALDQISTLTATPELRREQIKLQVNLVNALMHLKGYAAPETKTALEQGRLFIERAQALGEPPEDPSLLFSVLFGEWGVNRIAFNGDAMRQLSAQFLALAEKQRLTVPMMNGHRVVGISLVLTGDISEGREHLDQAIALYKPAEHGPLATRFGTDIGTSILSYRSIALWLLGYPEAALADTDRAINTARGLGQAASLMFAIHHVSLTHLHAGNYAAAQADADELLALSDDKDASFWRSLAIVIWGCLLTLRGDNSHGIQTITQGIATLRSTGATAFLPLYLPFLATAHKRLNQFDEAWRVIDEAMTMVKTSKESWCEAEVHRIAGEVALVASDRNAEKTEEHFERALAVARRQEAKSWELRAAMSLARLWRDQGKVQQARELLAPVYGWFTEGFDTRDLKEAKALLDALPEGNLEPPPVAGSAKVS